MRRFGGVVMFLMLFFALGSSRQKSASADDSPPIGVAIGQPAPGFDAVDQFGRAQNLETLRGTNGTILLFFRSADW